MKEEIQSDDFYYYCPQRQALITRIEKKIKQLKSELAILEITNPKSQKEKREKENYDKSKSDSRPSDGK